MGNTASEKHGRKKTNPTKPPSKNLTKPDLQNDNNNIRAVVNTVKSVALDSVQFVVSHSAAFQITYYLDKTVPEVAFFIGPIAVSVGCLAGMVTNFLYAGNFSLSAASIGGAASGTMFSRRHFPPGHIGGPFLNELPSAVNNTHDRTTTNSYHYPSNFQIINCTIRRP